MTAYPTQKLVKLGRLSGYYDEYYIWPIPLKLVCHSGDLLYQNHTVVGSVDSISPNTWYNISRLTLACRLFMVVGMDSTWISLSKDKTSCLNSFHYGKQFNHVLSKNWLILVLHLSGISPISNHPVTGSTKNVIAVRIFKYLICSWLYMDIPSHDIQASIVSLWQSWEKHSHTPSIVSWNFGILDRPS